MPNSEFDEQASAQVQQLLAERANAVAYGQTDRVASLDKTLAGLRRAAAVKPEQTVVEKSEPRMQPPVGRRAREHSES